MKRVRSCAAVVASACISMPAWVEAVPVGTAFTYQGRLQQDGVAVDNPSPGCAFTFRLWNDPTSTNPVDQVGNAQVLLNVPVVGGVFTVVLNSGNEFGPNAFNGEARWVEIGVACPSGGAFTPLAPRQPVTATPYALQTRGIFVSDLGDVGIGTINPAALLHVAEGTSGTGVILPGLRVEQNATSPNVIGGFSGNMVVGGVVGAVIGGGGHLDSVNSVQASWGTIGGGRLNTASGGRSTVGGGQINTASGFDSTVGGGGLNTASDSGCTVGGGADNTASGHVATVAGGQSNTASGFIATVGGGVSNTAVGVISTIAGGDNNSASGDFATVGGGIRNTASAGMSTVPGGIENVAGGSFSFAAGRRAKVRTPAEVGGGDTNGDEGTFVWADSTNESFSSTGPNQFLVRAAGGVGINTASPAATLDAKSASTAASANAVLGEIASTAPGGFSAGVRGINRGTGGSGIGVYGSQDGAGWGVHGAAVGGRGVFGWATGASGVNYGVYGQSNSTTGYDFYAGGVGIDYGSSSSIRWKKNVKPIEQPLEKVSRLCGVAFDWDAEHGGHHDVGMIAEEVGKVLPEIVSYEENGIDAAGMDYSKLTPLLVEAVKELKIEVKARDDQIAELNARLERLEKRFAERTYAKEDSQ